MVYHGCPLLIHNHLEVLSPASLKFLIPVLFCNPLPRILNKHLGLQLVRGFLSHCGKGNIAPSWALVFGLLDTCTGGITYCLQDMAVVMCTSPLSVLSARSSKYAPGNLLPDKMDKPCYRFYKTTVVKG
ncbi:hypothetical protein GOODEAATRI_033189 [Goodea atripinnis]|uniref:Uncharacterized protein n=1 Tax=Goodea atripinnis TaxID=208336 RepID=A0ABV0P9S0_9TELE